MVAFIALFLPGVFGLIVTGHLILGYNMLCILSILSFCYVATRD
jgi:hypothetical protein